MMLETIRFDESGLVPAIVQDNSTGEVLMLGFMSAESLALTLQTGETWFWNRSRGELWNKGAVTGNRQRVVELRMDCDESALVVRVEPSGPACHTGERSCFYRSIAGEPPGPSRDRAERQEPVLKVVDLNAMELGIQLQDLFTLILHREAERPEGSYTSSLFNAGLDAILAKLGSSAVDSVITAKGGSGKEMVSELSNHLYHLLVLMVAKEIQLRDVVDELSARSGRNVEPRPALREG